MTLLECRLKLGWSKKQAYTFLDCSPNTYEKYESDPYLAKTERYKDYLRLLSSRLDPRSMPPIDCTIDDFAILRQKQAFYIDKTMLIKEILDTGESCMLFARPRRFGKSLNLSMIRHFFDLHSNPELFNGLEISKEKELCETYQNRFPVLFLTLKDVEGKRFEDFLIRLGKAIAYAAFPHLELLGGKTLTDIEKSHLKALINETSDKETLRSSLLDLSALLYRVYDQRVIILIDEYDVPLQKASMEDYYDDALDIISGLLSSGLKSNPFLEKGILTGCLRVSKETIFTGLNNVTSYSFLSPYFKNAYGFTEEEVGKALSTYCLETKKAEVKKYYDGYPGEGTKLYCPFDVMHYIRDHRKDVSSPPLYYWMNTSENEIIRALLEISTPTIRDEIQLLIDGGSVTKKLDLYLTYRNLYQSADNIYSILFASGYLVANDSNGIEAKLSIPNEEVRHIFKEQFQSWLNEACHNEGPELGLSKLLYNGDLEEASSKVSQFLWNTIGIHDYARPIKEQESFYHGLLLGLLSQDEKSVRIDSNKEAGTGYLDIALCSFDSKKRILIECKCARDGDDEKAYAEAMSQVDLRRYKAFFPKGMEVTIIVASFYQKRCSFLRGKSQ